MAQLILSILISIVITGCSGLFISQRYSPSVNDKWNKLENRAYAYSLQLDSSVIEIRNIPVKDIGFTGPVLIPIIPILINKYQNKLYIDLHVGLNDSITLMIPPKVYLYNPQTHENIEPIEITPINFKLIKKLKLYHREFEYSGNYRINRTYFYRFDVNKKESILYFKIDSLGKNKNMQELLKYELKKRVKYIPIIIPRPS